MMGTTRRHRMLANIAMAVLCLVVMVPLYRMVVTSLQPLQLAIRPDSTWLPTSWHWDNFVELFRRQPFLRYFLNSVLVATVIGAANVATTSLAGYALAQRSLPLRRILTVAVLSSAMVPAEMVFIPNYVLVQQLGIYDTYAGLIIPWVASAFGVFLFRQVFLGIPGEIIEAARIDGAASFRIFRSVALPLARPAVITTFLVTFVWSWNSLLWPLLVTQSEHLKVLPLGLVSLQAEAGLEVNLVMAAAAFAVLPILAVFILAQRTVIDGLTSGSHR